jgi:polyphosphate kinase
MSMALIGCQERQTAHDATMEIAEDVSEDAISPLKDRVTSLEERLTALAVDLQAEETYSKAVHAALNEERENRAKDLNALRDHYNDHLSRFHGAP